MNSFNIIFSYLRAKLLTNLLQILLMVLAVSMLTILICFASQMQEKIYGDGKNIDLVVGAKGSPLQLILSSVQQMDVPTGNILYSDYLRISKRHEVKQAVPISLGDNYHRFRIVGTNQQYLGLFSAELVKGSLWQNPMEVVIGAKVAKDTGLQIGDRFFGSHGLIPGGEVHENSTYQVVGILDYAHNVIDRLIVTSLESVWDVHHQHEHDEHEEGHDEQKDEHEHEDEHEKDDDLEREVTAILLKYKTRLAEINFPRQINRNTNMQAASPKFEMTKLISLIGFGTNTIMVFSGFILVISLIGMFIGLLNNIRDRKYDLAIFRVLGASKHKIFGLIIGEGMIISVIACVLGVCLGYAFFAAIALLTNRGIEFGLESFVFNTSIIWLVISVLFVSFLACLIPAIEAYRTDIKIVLTQS